jgi:hypothetical protein
MRVNLPRKDQRSALPRWASAVLKIVSSRIAVRRDEFVPERFHSIPISLRPVEQTQAILHGLGCHTELGSSDRDASGLRHECEELPRLSHWLGSTAPMRERHLQVFIPSRDLGFRPYAMPHGLVADANVSGDLPDGFAIDCSIEHLTR